MFASTARLAASDSVWRWICGLSDATDTKAAIAIHGQLAPPTIAMRRYLHRAASANSPESAFLASSLVPRRAQFLTFLSRLRLAMPRE